MSHCRDEAGEGAKRLVDGGSRTRSWSLWVKDVLGLNLLTVVLPTGSFYVIIMELGRQKIKYLLVISLLKRSVPEELRSCSLGNVWKLSPNKIEILPEWDS